MRRELREEITSTSRSVDYIFVVQHGCKVADRLGRLK